jgi:hypothetical protein
MALEPGPMRVIHNFFTTKSEVLADIDKLDFWPTTYVSDRMVYIVGLPVAANLFDKLTLLDPALSPAKQW